MTITAKYAGRCTICGQAISVGAQIEWQKGAGSKHVACVGGTASPAPRSRPSHRRRNEDNECELCGRNKYTCGHCIGW